MLSTAGWQARPDERAGYDQPGGDAHDMRGSGEAGQGMGRPVSNCVALLLASDPGAASHARPGFAVYVTRGGGGPMSAKALLGVGGLRLG
jgi:hypothetical protein